MPNSIRGSRVTFSNHSRNGVQKILNWCGHEARTRSRISFGKVLQHWKIQYIIWNWNGLPNSIRRSRVTFSNHSWNGVPKILNWCGHEATWSRTRSFASVQVVYLFDTDRWRIKRLIQPLISSRTCPILPSPQSSPRYTLSPHQTVISLLASGIAILGVTSSSRSQPSQPLTNRYDFAIYFLQNIHATFYL